MGWGMVGAVWSADDIINGALFGLTSCFVVKSQLKKGTINDDSVLLVDIEFMILLMVSFLWRFS